MQFSYVNPTMIHFGQGQIASIRRDIPKDHKVLVLYGGGSIKRNGVYDQVVEALSEHQWVEFSGVEPNPTKETLDKAVHIVKNQHIDFILAVGGGSVIDGSKYVAAAAFYEGDGWDILTGQHTVKQATPIGAILTLPATYLNPILVRSSPKRKHKINWRFSLPPFSHVLPCLTLM